MRLAHVVPVREAAGERFVALLRDLPEDAGSLPVPGLKWTVAETAVHMLTVLRRGLVDFRRSETLEGLAELNDLCIQEVDERSLAVIADLIDEASAKAVRGLQGMSDEQADEGFPLHMGLSANVPTAISYGIFDLLGHGYDIARATGHDWPFDPLEVGTMMRTILPAMRPWIPQEIIDGEPREERIAFVPDVVLSIRTGGGLWSVTNATDATDEVDPVELFLAVAGREPASDPVVTRIASWFSPI